MPTATPTILQGWKEIALYVARDVRTVRRWEKRRGLPVRRMPGEGRPNVYIVVTELDAWLLLPETTEAIENLPFPALEEPSDPLNIFAFLRPHAAALGAGLIAILLTTAAYLRTSLTHFQSAPQPIRAVAQPTPAHLPSAVPGVEALYIRGVYSYEQRTAASLLQAEQLLRNAAQQDPTFAPPHAGLAITYNLLREYGSMPASEAYAASRTEAERAIALDPRLSDAHAALGFIEFFWDWKCADAESEFKSAIELNPASATAHQWYGSMLMHEARFSEAVVQLDVAQRLEPNSTAILYMRAIALGQIPSRRQEAIALLKLVPKENATFTSARVRLANLYYLQPRDLNAYLSEKQNWATAAHDPAAQANFRAMRRLYQQRGEHAMWARELARLHAAVAASGNPITPGQRLQLADFETGIGDENAAFKELESLARSHANEMIGINLVPELEPLHDDPRYNAILRTIGLPPLLPPPR